MIRPVHVPNIQTQRNLGNTMIPRQFVTLTIILKRVTDAIKESACPEERNGQLLSR